MAALSLEVQVLSAGYGSTRIIESVSFRADSGVALAVLGRNGAGKTTLLKSLMGFTRRHTGSILLGGADISGMPPSARARRGLGYVPQTRDIFGSLTVQENLFAGLKDRPSRAIIEAYELFPRLQERKGLLGSQLSGGEQQMLSIARTLLGEPGVLLLDEPLEGLAPAICDELMASLQGLASTGKMTIVLIEQQIERALYFAQNILILERGQLVWMGPPDVLWQNRGIVDRHLGVGVH